MESNAVESETIKRYVDALKSCLDQPQPSDERIAEREKLHNLLYSVENQSLLDASSWDVAVLLCSYLTSSASSSTSTVCERIREPLVHLCSTSGSAKELTLVLLQHANSLLTNDDIVCLFVDCMCILLSRSVADGLTRRQRPQQHNKLVAHSTRTLVAKVDRYIRARARCSTLVLHKLVDFVEFFLTEKCKLIQPDAVDESYVTNCMLNLFSRSPLTDLCHKQHVDCEFELARRIYTLLVRLNKDIVKLYATQLSATISDLPPKKTKSLDDDDDDDDDDDSEDEDIEDDDVQVEQAAPGCFLAFVYTHMERLTAGWPLVYEPFHLFVLFWPYVERMVSSGSNDSGGVSLLTIGLHALELMLDRCNCNTLSADWLQVDAVERLVTRLLNAMVYSHEQEARTTANRVFKAFFSLFVAPASRLAFIEHYLNRLLRAQHRRTEQQEQSNDHDATFVDYASAFLVFLLKEEIGIFFHSLHDAPSSILTCVSRLITLVLYKCYNPTSNGECTIDVLAESNRIKAALNTLIFVLIRSRNNNVSAKLIGAHVASYLDQLSRAVSVTRARCESEKRQPVDTSSSSQLQVSFKHTNEQVMLDGRDGGGGDGENARQALDASLVTLDILDMLRARVSELFAEMQLNNNSILNT